MTMVTDSALSTAFGLLQAGTIAAAHELPTHLATILLVEDEESVRSVTREVLETEGYRVLEAQDAIDGIRLCEQHQGRINLVLTDVVMPGMNGRDMARKLVEMHPELRVIFMSGYTDNPVLREAFADCCTVYLQKPFTVQTLREKVRAVLNGRTLEAEPHDCLSEDRTQTSL